MIKFLFFLGLLGMPCLLFSETLHTRVRDQAVFLIAGQSNAVGQGTAEPDSKPQTSALEYKYETNTLVAVKDPVGEPLLRFEKAHSGSAWPSFAEQFSKAGNALVLIPAARGGSSCDARAELKSYGTWAEGGKLFLNAILKTNAALKLAKAPLSGIIWSQGERDANAINEGKLTVLQYEESLRRLISRFRSIYGQSLPFYIIQTGYYHGHPKQGFDLVQKAQERVAATVAHAHIVYKDARLFTNKDMLPDGIHYNQQSLNKIGKEVAINIRRIMNERLAVAGIFTPHMVLQEGLQIPVWGSAGAGDRVTLSLNKTTVSVTTSADGKWMARFPSMPYGGPYVLTVKSGKQTITIGDVMIGEVWLASGQSNMNFQIGYPVSNLKDVLADSDLSVIREFAVPLTVRNQPSNDVPNAGWKVCNPTDVLQFSAVAFFFAKKIHQQKKVAVGIIHTSYGGTPIEAWLPGREKNEGNWEALQAISDSIDVARKVVIDTAAQGVRIGVHTLNYDDRSWGKAKYPVTTSKFGPAYGFVWFRLTIDIPALMSKGDLKLKMGKLAESDITYFNGAEIGRGKQEDSTIYTVPSGLIREGKNVIAIRLVSQWGNGKLGFPADSAFLENPDQSIRIPLSGEWRYNNSIEPVLVKGTGYQNQPSVLFNGMVHPMVHYAIKGFLWYQGESNTGNYRLYEKQQPELIKSWRKQWGLGNIPFLFVQLPGLRGSTNLPMMREAQAASLKEVNTGMAVSIDAGDPYDVHPHKKQPIGERLGLQALGLVYDKKIIKDGPVYQSCAIEGASIRLKFAQSTSSVVLKNLSGSAFMIAGEDQKFYPAEVRLENNEILVSAKSVAKPIAVRYAWDPDPQASLYNSEGIPAAPFRTDKWPN